MTSPGLHTIEPYHLLASRQLALAAGGIKEDLQDQPLYILVGTFSTEEVLELKHMKIPHVTVSQDGIHAIEGVDRKIVLIGRPEDYKQRNPTLFMQPSSDVSAVLYDPTEIRETQTQRHNVVQNYDLRKRRKSVETKLNFQTSTRLTVKTSSRCWPGSLSLWHGHLICINVAKLGIKLLNFNTRPVHSASYRAEPKTREFN